MFERTLSLSKTKSLFLARLLTISALWLGIALQQASALVEIDITKANVEPLPIAIPSFVGSGGQTDIARKIASVVEADLKRSGLFAPINHGAFIEKISNPDNTPRFSDWKVINAQAVVVGRVSREADGRLRTEFRLWDVFAAEQLTGQSFLPPTKIGAGLRIL